MGASFSKIHLPLFLLVFYIFSCSVKPSDREVEATHVTEELDTLWWGILESETADESKFTDTMVG